MMKIKEALKVINEKLGGTNEKGDTIGTLVQKIAENVPASDSSSGSEEQTQPK